MSVNWSGLSTEPSRNRNRAGFVFGVDNDNVGEIKPEMYSSDTETRVCVRVRKQKVDVVVFNVKSAVFESDKDVERTRKRAKQTRGFSSIWHSVYLHVHTPTCSNTQSVA